MSMRSFRALQSYDRWRHQDPHSREVKAARRAQPTYGVARAVCPHCGLEQRVPRFKLETGEAICRGCKAALGRKLAPKAPATPATDALTRKHWRNRAKKRTLATCSSCGITRHVPLQIRQPRCFKCGGCMVRKGALYPHATAPSSGDRSRATSRQTDLAQGGGSVGGVPRPMTATLASGADRTAPAVSDRARHVDTGPLRSSPP